MLVFEFIYKPSHTHITKWTEPGMIRFMWVDAFFWCHTRDWHYFLICFSIYVGLTEHHSTEAIVLTMWQSIFTVVDDCERCSDDEVAVSMDVSVWGDLYSCAACLMSIEIDHFNQHKCNTFFFFSIEFEVKVKLSNAIRNITTRKNTNTQTQTNMLCAGETTKC